MTPFTSSRLIKYLVCDIDGCLVGVGHKTFDLEKVADMVRLNQESAHDPVFPALTILSGRPHPYVDALMQLFDIHAPASFENGAGLAYRFPYRALIQEGIEAGLEDLRTLQRLLSHRNDITVQLGKVASASFFPFPKGGEIAPVVTLVTDLIEEHRLDLHVDPAHDCVNVLVPGVDKGTGLVWLARELGVSPEEVAGIGDSVGDICWLERCGVSCAPANADPAVKRVVSVVSERQDIDAALSFYQNLIESNKAHLSRS